MKKCNNCGTKSCANNGKIGVPIGCNDYTPPMPQTNTDRIRSASDEELAEWIEKLSGCSSCPGFDTRCDNRCMDFWLDWLKSPASEGE